MDFLVAMVMHNKESSNDKYHLGGYAKAGVAVQTRLGVACVAAWPVEVILLKLLEDDRFFLHAGDLHRAMEEAQASAMQLPVFFWDAMARLIGCPATTGPCLQDIAVQAMLAGVGYVEYHGFALLKEDPWRLTQGDIERNLEQLAQEDLQDISSLVCRNIALCQRVMPFETLLAVQLLRDAPCSIGLIEKGHAPGAFIKKAHKRLGPLQLQAANLKNFYAAQAA